MAFCRSISLKFSRCISTALVTILVEFSDIPMPTETFQSRVLLGEIFFRIIKTLSVALLSETAFSGL